MTSIKSIIDSTANKYGVDPWIAEDIAKLESNFKPNAVGDNGTSFGLYQLHWGGQGTGYTSSQLENPQTNATIGISNMSSAYKKGVKAGLSGYALLDYTATHSGHPGYGGVGKYPSYEKTLKSVYEKGGGAPNNALSGLGNMGTIEKYVLYAIGGIVALKLIF